MAARMKKAFIRAHLSGKPHRLSREGFGPSSKEITSRSLSWTMKVLANLPYVFYYLFHPAASQCVLRLPELLLCERLVQDSTMMKVRLCVVVRAFPSSVSPW